MASGPASSRDVPTLARALRPLWATSLAHPRAALVAIGALVAVAASGLARLELRIDGHALVPAAAPEVRFDAEVRAAFGLRDPILVVIESSHPDGIYNPRTLRSVADLSRSLAALEGIGPEHVMSLATEARPRVHVGTLRFRRLLEPFPDTPELLAELREDVAEIGLLEGTLVGRDGRAVAILVGCPPPVGSEGGIDRAALYARIRSLAQGVVGEGDRVYVVGAPAAESLLGAHILSDLVRLVPLAIGIVSIVVFVGCRRPWGVAIALGEVGACLLFVLGSMGWFGVPVHLTTALLPVILTTTGLTDDIHVLWQVQRELSRDAAGGAAAAADRALCVLARPITLTSATTALGFLSFAIAPIEAVESFGRFAALGIAFCWLYSLTAVPASLALLGAARIARPPERARRDGVFVGRAVSAAVARPVRTLRILGIATASLGAGIVGLRVQDSWIEGFSRESELRRDTERVETLLAGTHVLLLHLGFEGRERPLLDPVVLEAIGGLERALRADPRVGGVLGPASHLAAVQYLFAGQRAGSRRIPATVEGTRSALASFDRARGAPRRREVIHDDLRQAVVTAYLPRANYRDVAALMDVARLHARLHLEPLGARLRFAGDVAVSQAMIPAIVRTQLGSLALAVCGGGLAVFLLLRSAQLALLAVLPTLAAIAAVLGVMGWSGIPLGVATSTFCAVVFGIGVDYAIHLLERIRAAPEGTARERVVAAAAEAGPAIVADALAVALGFGILGFSSVPANARLGFLVATALVSAAAFTLLGLPALLVAHEGPRHRPSPQGTAPSAPLARGDFSTHSDVGMP